LAWNAQSILEQVSETKRVVVVNDSMTLELLLKTFLESDTDVVLLDENTVLSDPHLELLTDYPRSTSAVLVGQSEEQLDVFVAGGRLLSVETRSHKATRLNRKFVGAVRLSKNQSDQIRDAVQGAIDQPTPGHPLELLLVSLVRAAVFVESISIKDAPFARSADVSVRAAVQESISRIKLSKLRLKMANRATDGFFSVFFLRKLSKPLTWVAVKIGATPNQVTIASFAIGLLAAFMFSKGTFLDLLAGAILLQLSIVVDCVDGELARYTRKFSQLGAWLDAITDRVKEYAVFLGLAYGAFVQHGQDLWLLAALLMTLQTFRHLSDYNFSQVAKARKAELPPMAVGYLAESDGIDPNVEIEDVEHTDPKSLPRRIRYWVAKMVVFPIGERWLVISATAAIGGAWLTFMAMPVFAAISMFWVYRRRIAKTLLMPNTRIQSKVIRYQFDLGANFKGLFIRFDWLEPSLLRGLELVALTALLFFTNNLSVAGFIVLFSIAYHHYDNLYRAMQDEVKPTWLRVLGLSAPGRIVLLSIVVVFGIELSYAATYFLALFLLVSSAHWVISHHAKQAKKR
jgi:phosphatidylglycerophosphate synthase